MRAVVLSGNGPAFCAGLDLARFAGIAEAGGATPAWGRAQPVPAGRITTDAQHTAWVWREIPVPVIAAVHGVAVGAGLQLALAADLRIVAEDARLGALEIRWGLTLDGTGTYSLPHSVRIDRAKELIWTGRMVSGREALALGLATRVAVDPRSEALALAGEIVAADGGAIRTSVGYFGERP